MLSADGMTVLKVHELQDPYTQIAERADYYVAICLDQSTVDLLDKKTLHPLCRIPVTNRRTISFVIHPTLPVTYVAFLPVSTGRDTDGFFGTLDEKSRQFHDSPSNLGQWLQIDASGQRLVSAGHFSHKAGEKLSIVPAPGFRPGPWGPLPGGGNRSIGVRLTPQLTFADAIFVYDLAEDGMPILSGHSIRPLANWWGLRMAPDGLRATCVSQIGVNEAMNLDALKDKPVGYAMEGGTILDLAYHPVLPLVACIGPTGPRLFQRETGQLQPNGVKYKTADFENATLRRLWFSADGKGVLLAMTDGWGKNCLYRAELDLSPIDLDKVRYRLANMTSLGRDLLVDNPPKPGNGTVPLAEIHALNGDRGREMSPKEIGRKFNDAVVIVQNGPSSGTGFVVGASGYVLTCAHCVGKDGRIVVSYRSSNGSDTEMKNGPAELVRVDSARDLALLKMQKGSSLPAVRLAIGDEIESGERVTIIGNPEVGQTTLSHTMTEGIVSNARRRLGRQTLIQTSAAVNPGSSGAPMFNSNGLVVGLVALKMNIEGAGFAVPASELGAFLAMTVKATGPEGAIQRQWCEINGKHETIAQYMGARDGAVQLRRVDGKNISVPLSKLSPEDRAFVHLFQSDTASK